MKSLSIIIQIKATEQYFPVVLFIMLYKVILTLSVWVEYLFDKEKKILKFVQYLMLAFWEQNGLINNVEFVFARCSESECSNYWQPVSQ